MVTLDVPRDKYLDAACEIIAKGARANLDEIYSRIGIGDHSERWRVISLLPTAIAISARENPVSAAKLVTQ